MRYDMKKYDIYIKIWCEYRSAVLQAQRRCFPVSVQEEFQVDGRSFFSSSASTHRRGRYAVFLLEDAAEMGGVFEAETVSHIGD